MICEKCQKEHNGTYGSGRFCCSKCARSFSTVINRSEINSKISSSMSGKTSPFKGVKWSHPMNEEHRQAISKNLKKYNLDRFEKLSYEELGNTLKRKRLMLEQDDKCDTCKNPEMWNDKPLRFQIDHIDGNKKNNSRSNHRLLCPNCHTQTDTWGNKRRIERKSNYTL